MKKIAIIGSGQVGRTLASGFLKYNFPTMIGSRSKEKQKELKETIGGSINVGNFKDAADFGEIVVLAVKGLAAKEALEGIDQKHLKNKIVIDTTNPIGEASPENGVLSFFTDQNNSLMEQLQDANPDAKFVKAFSCIGSGLMVNPHFPKGEKPGMFICGNNLEAKKEVAKILDLFGFEIEDMGGAEAARAIEPLCMLWCIPGFKDNSWTHAFRLLKQN
jgi:hypothetical protein